MTGEGVEPPRARFLGFGVSAYEHGQASLPGAGPDVTKLRSLLGDQVEGEAIVDPTEEKVREYLRSVQERPSAAPAILAWSGHGVTVGSELRLLASNSLPSAGAGLSVNDLALTLADSGTSQLLLILDVCYSGNGAGPALVAALSAFMARPPVQRRAWAGVLASCQPEAFAVDGLFGRRLRRLLSRGPHDLRSAEFDWSDRNEWITGHALGDAVLRNWDITGAEPLFAQFGVPWKLVRNPLYRASMPNRPHDRLVERVLSGTVGHPAADPDFVGRARALATVVTWIDSGVAGLGAVIGAPGSGKSALLSQALIRAERPVQGFVNARGRTVERLAAALDEALAQAGFLTAAEPEANPLGLVGRVRQALTAGQEVPVVVVDGLDEAGGPAFEIAARLLRPLADHLTVIVGTREVASDGPGGSLLSLLSPEHTMDIDALENRASNHADLRLYLTSRLTGISPTMAVEPVVDRLMGLGDQTFLLARIVTDQLRAEAVDTGAAHWSDRVHQSVTAAVQADVEKVPAPTHRRPAAGFPPAALARQLLAALAWAYGTGFPMEEWVAVAAVLIPGGFGVDQRDTTWLLETLGRYVVQDAEGGAATYRPAHDALTDLLGLRPARDTLAGREARAVAAALTHRYRRLVEAGTPASAAHYLWRYAWRHAVDAGAAGLGEFQAVVALDPSLWPQRALGELELAGRLRACGNRGAAVPHAERAAEIYRERSAQTAAGQADLAGALNNLSVLYRDVGRVQEAVLVGREVVGIYRWLSDVAAAATPDLAAALSNLGVYYRGADQLPDAIDAGIEAVRLSRLAAEPGARAALAMALTNLCDSLRAAGRCQQAHEAAVEATTLYRAVVRPNAPELGSALSGLGLCLRGLGRLPEAIAALGEATEIYREALVDDPALAPNLAVVLRNRSASLAVESQSEPALAAAREAVELFRGAADREPYFQLDLGAAAADLSDRLRLVGHFTEALTVARDAVRWCRQVYEADAGRTAALVSLARALGQLAACSDATGASAEALAATEEAAELHRRAVEAGRVPNELAGALFNLGLARHGVGLHRDAAAALRECVELHRQLDATPLADPGRFALALDTLIAFTAIAEDG